MIHDIGLRWLVTLLFLFSAAVCVRGIVAGRHSPAGLISHSLHAVMAIAMAVMAWPRGAELPPRAPMIFFAAAAVWFAITMVIGRDHRAANGYHTLMMAAMAWMYAAMGGLSLPRAQSETASPAGMDMAAMSGPGGHAGHSGHGAHAAAADPGPGALGWVGILNWLCALGFAVAALVWLYRFITSRRHPGAGPRDSGLGILCQVAMAAGMAVMFAVML